MIILAIDLGKFNSVACCYDTTSAATFPRLKTGRHVLAHLVHVENQIDSPSNELSIPSCFLPK